MDDRHAELTEQAFTRQAATFEDARFNQVLTRESDWVFAKLPLNQRDVMLDLACGTGLGSRGLAGEVRAVVALDATGAMLEVGKAAAEQSGIRNIVFQRGDAAALPFLDASFSVVICRYAVHHFADPDVQMAEIARVLGRYGKLAIADLIADEHAEIAVRQNEIERLRDPSHARALSGSELQALIVRHGLEATAAETREVRRPLGPWLDQTGTDGRTRAEVERRLLAEIDGGEVTGLQPQPEADGALTIVQTLTSVSGLKPDR
jgi:SAM-dependent methyltransferase